jgi:N-acetylmuramoyl-L-alanine amidase
MKFTHDCERRFNKRPIERLHRLLLKYLSPILLFFFAFSGWSRLQADGVVDYQQRLNPRFRKVVRKETHYIIVHDTESRLPSALRTLSRGKIRHGRYITHGGHAHFLVGKNGTVYRILDSKYWANHAGVSMWEGLEDLSDYSVGIELEGYHNVPFSEEQYKSLRRLIKQLQEKYGIDDQQVLEHYRVAYSKPNRYHKSKQRGRKLDPGPGNFDRRKAGLNEVLQKDPDVLAGRIRESPELMKASGTTLLVTDEIEEDEGSADVSEESRSRKIARGQTAWQITRSQYNAPTTLYRLPNGTTLRGDQVNDWSKLVPGTEVQLGVALAPAAIQGEVSVPTVQEGARFPVTSGTNTPWKIANALYRSSFTYYIFPDGRIRSGHSMTKEYQVPNGTKVLVAYREIGRPRTTSQNGEDLREIYLDSHTLYVFPDRNIQSGDQVEDFSKLPAGTRVFAKLD